MKSYVFLPGKGMFNSYDRNSPVKRDDELIDYSDAKKFHIGQSYDEKPAELIICVKCGSNKFFVGQGHCFTAIKCINCEWELCIHDG